MLSDLSQSQGSRTVMTICHLRWSGGHGIAALGQAHGDGREQEPWGCHSFLTDTAFLAHSESTWI